jgi:hypothetical protein
LRMILPSLKLWAIKSFPGTPFNCDLLTFFTKLKHQWLLLRSVFASVTWHTTLKNIKARQPLETVCIAPRDVCHLMFHQCMIWMHSH